MEREELRIVRVQDADGRGPWKPGFSHRWVEPRDDHENLIPWFQEFGDVRNRILAGEHVGSGCSTVAQLRRWFTESEYRTLLEFGYRAVELDADRLLAASDIQCVFTRSRPLNDGARMFSLYALAAIPPVAPAVAGQDGK